MTQDAGTTTTADAGTKDAATDTQQQETDKGGKQETTAFAPITSQADLDRILGDRLTRERGKFADYDDLKAKAAEFDKAEEARKSDLEKATARAEAAEAKLQEREAADAVTALRKEIAGAKKVPLDLLRGSTKEEIEAHADELLKVIKPGGPVVTADQTASSSGDGGTSDWLGEALRAKH